MNEIKAIELLRNMLPEKVSYANLVGASNCYGDKYVYENPEPYAIGLAISALEKQIPKPIVGIKAQLQNRYCPSCNEWMFFDKYGQAKYCPTCGQSIDWSVEE